MSDTIIVVPCYNEAERLDLPAFRQFVAAGYPQRFLFVNDGSTDATADVLRSFCGENAGRFELLDLARNRGKAEAVRRGMLHAIDQGAQRVGFWDADLATPLEAIPEFCRLFDADPELRMVLGSRVRLLGRRIERRALRHYLGRAFATAASLVLGLSVYDTQCGAKLFRVDSVLRASLAEPFRSRWIFDVELLARLVQRVAVAGRQDVERAIRELPLEHWRDVAGSKLKARDFLRALIDLLIIARAYPRTGAAPAPVEQAGVPAPSGAGVSLPRRRTQQAA